MTYTEAIKKALDGDETGFEYLYHQTKNQKYYLALKYVGDEETAKDVLQESYIKAWKNLDCVEPEKFESWLATIVANTAKNVIVKRKRTALDLREEIDDEMESNEVFDRAVSSWENMPELNYTRKETAELVHEMLHDLPEEQRMTLLLFEIEGLTIREIAEALECSEATVKSRLKYGRNKIKTKGEELQKKGYKLYSLAPTVLLVWLLREESQSFVAESATSGVLEHCKKEMQRSKALSKSAGLHKLGLKAFVSTKVGKLTVGALAAVVIGGTSVGIIAHNNKTLDTSAIDENTNLSEEKEEKDTESQNNSVDVEQTEGQEIVYENEDGSDPFFDYENRFELGDPDSMGVSGNMNIVDLDHVKKYTGEVIKPVNEDWEINSVSSVMISMLLYEERNARKEDVTSAGNAYHLSPLNYIEVPNGSVVHVEKSITIGAEHIWGTPALGGKVTIYKVTSEEFGDGYLLQSAFNGLASDVE